ncbi:phage portal protein (plasmid) [Microbulbifer sp. ANSA001]|uniref:phage portal protein n=1 Tax=Microbulbifer sp. ANSA001 TaxID=3243358 RepID=UPI004043923F
MRVKSVHTKPRIRCTPGMDTRSRIKAVYEGASTGPRLGSKGLIGVGGPNADISGKLPALRKRSRHAVRNNPYATGAKETYVSNMVGNGIIAKWGHERLQELWDRWILECDADDKGSFLGAQMQAAGAQFESGEVLTRRRFRYRSDGLIVPLQLQMLEADHLDETYSVQGEHNPVVLGVEFNDFGQRAKYHLWRDHPSDGHRGFSGNIRREVPADDVIHLFRRLRPGQVRGIPEMTPVLVRLYEIDEMQDATLVKQKTAQLFAWIVKKIKHYDGIGGETNQPNTSGPAMGTPETGPNGEQLERIRAGGIHYLEDDEELQFSDPSDVGSNYAAWLKTELRAVARGLGLTYEQLTGDLEGLNFSSIRAGLLEFRRRIEQLQYSLLIHRWCRPVSRWFADTAVMSGVVDIPFYWRDPDSFLPSWKSPRWAWVDPLKDVMADILEIRGGLNTLQNKLGERTLDYNEVTEQLAVEQALDLILDTNPSKLTASGQFQDLVKLAIQSQAQEA